MLRRASVLLALSGLAASAQQDQPRPAVPREPVGAIVEIFQSHPLVGLGEGPHGNVEGHRFRLSLLRDPRFLAAVNDIVVEFGAGQHQELMDRFVRGEPIHRDALRRVWEDTTNVNPGWERPIYEEFFRAVRDVNASLPRERQLRVLLADPPIDWDTVRTSEDLRNVRNKGDAFQMDLIRREVLAKNRRALLIFGDGHFQGRGEGRSISGRFDLEGVHVWTISSGGGDLQSVQPDVAAWPVPSLASLQGTLLGVKEYGFYYPIPPVRADFWRAMKMQGQFDALLYLGPTRTFSDLPVSLCTDSRYMTMRIQRMALGAGGQGDIDRFTRDCGSRNQK